MSDHKGVGRPHGRLGLARRLGLVSLYCQCQRVEYESRTVAGVREGGDYAAGTATRRLETMPGNEKKGSGQWGRETRVAAPCDHVFRVLGFGLFMACVVLANCVSVGVGRDEPARAGGQAYPPLDDARRLASVPPSPTLPDVPPVYVSPHGVDNATCGHEAGVPCATLAFAVNVIASALPSQADVVPIVLAAGLYSSSSCGAVASRPVSITGAGSSVTLIDCNGQSRAFATNASIWLSGVTISNGWCTVTNSSDSVASYGGGGVQVLWGPVPNATALFLDVLWVNNSVSSGCSYMSTLPCMNEWPGALPCSNCNGGGLFLLGGGDGTNVTMLNCSFHFNGISSPQGIGEGDGGGASIIVGAFGQDQGALMCGVLCVYLSCL
jgi:hypothetical protein